MKLNKMIKYSCWSVLKPLSIFYIIMYGIMTFFYLVDMGTDSSVYFSGMEVSCFIYLAITGSLTFSEDFKMFIQNGFTRKNIFLANITMFTFLSVIMSIIDITMAYLFNIWRGYTSLFEGTYGAYQINNKFILKFIWYIMVYFLVISIAHCCSLIMNRIGKKIFWISLSVLFVLTFMIFPGVFISVLEKDFLDNFYKFFQTLFGFDNNTGTANLLNPILMFFILSVIFNGISYLLIRKSQIKK